MALVETETIVEPKMMICGFSYYHHYINCATCHWMLTLTKMLH